MTDEPRKRERPASALTIEIIRKRCTGVGTCVSCAPRTFDTDDDGVAYVLRPNGDPDDKIRAAAESCPTDAIVLRDAATGAQVWPLTRG